MNNNEYKSADSIRPGDDKVVRALNTAGAGIMKFNRVMVFGGAILFFALAVWSLFRK